MVNNITPEYMEKLLSDSIYNSNFNIDDNKDYIIGYKKGFLEAANKIASVMYPGKEVISAYKKGESNYAKYSSGKISINQALDNSAYFIESI